jgi:hypothetical protein
MLSTYVSVTKAKEVGGAGPNGVLWEEDKARYMILAKEEEKTHAQLTQISLHGRCLPLASLRLVHGVAVMF